MNYRKLLLRIVFWALGLAAGFGAAGVIFAGHDTLWRIVGTCAATAVGALLLLWAAQFLEAEASWFSGFLAVSLIVIEYLTILGLIWAFFGRAEERVAITAVCLAGTGISAVGFARVITQPPAVVLARFGLVASAAVFVLFMVGTWDRVQGQFLDVTWRWHQVAFSLAGFSILAVISLVGAGTDRRHWRWLAVVAAAAGFAISAYAILKNVRETSALFICIVSLAAVVAHANALLCCPIKPGQRWLLWATIGAAITTGALVDLGAITKPWQEEFLGRMAGASAIITGCGTLAVLVLARLQRRSGPEAAATRSQPPAPEIVLVCPRCGRKQRLPMGVAKCACCGLGIEVRVHKAQPEVMHDALEKSCAAD